MNNATNIQSNAFRTDTLAMHLIAAIAGAHGDGRRTNLDDLVQGIGARRGDVRRALSALHQQGYLDVLRMRPTLQGLALGRALAGRNLPVLREAPLAIVRAA